MRICQVGTGTLPIPSNGAGGVENTVHHLSDALVALGHEVTVIDVRRKGRRPAVYEVVEVGPLWPRFANLFEHGLRGLTFQIGVWRALQVLSARRSFDVIHFHGQLGTGVNLEVGGKGIVKVFSSHNPTWGDARLCSSKMLRAKFFWEMAALKWADGIICDSATMRQNFISQFGVACERIRNIPIGVDEEILGHKSSAWDVRMAYSLGSDRLILNVARIAPYKDQVTLLRAFALVRENRSDVRLLLVGPPTDRAYAKLVRQEVDRLGLQASVAILGEVPRSHLLDFYEVCDVFVLSSVNEAQGLSLLEAMAKGRPVVASCIGPVQEVVSDSSGLLVRPQSPVEFAQAILALLEDPVLAKDMGERGRKTATGCYRWRTIAQRTVEAYEAFRLLRGSR